ncbi:hypothetical protein SK128_021904 [Halocaridina rubra]|uniref:Uncharacterized protein n=1 Tax=Halocaridina rubra TaxID=373956 RepID=A0AAN8X4R2_HALRR
MEPSRDLGVNILADLSPEIHINGIVRAAYAFLSNVRVAFRHMDKEMFRNIYVTYDRYITITKYKMEPIRRREVISFGLFPVSNIR